MDFAGCYQHVPGMVGVTCPGVATEDEITIYPNNAVTIARIGHPAESRMFVNPEHILVVTADQDDRVTTSNAREVKTPLVIMLGDGEDYASGGAGRDTIDGGNRTGRAM